MAPEDVEGILRKHGSKIEGQLQTSFSNKKSDYSQAYLKFKEEMSPEVSRYERWAKSLGNVIRLKVSEKDSLKIKRFLDIAHLDLEPWQPLTLSVMAFLGALLLSVLISLAVFLIRGFTGFPVLFFFLAIIFSFFVAT